MDLYHHITPMVDQFLSMEEISQKLFDEHELEITSKRLRYILHYYRRKLEKASKAAEPFASATFPLARPIVQNQENNQQPPSSPSQFQPGRKLIIDEDFRTPTPKPRPIFGTKEASNS